MIYIYVYVYVLCLFVCLFATALEIYPAYSLDWSLQTRAREMLFFVFMLEAMTYIPAHQCECPGIRLIKHLNLRIAVWSVWNAPNTSQALPKKDSSQAAFFTRYMLCCLRPVIGYKNPINALIKKASVSVPQSCSFLRQGSSANLPRIVA